MVEIIEKAGIKHKMVIIPEGTFLMGSDKGEECEKPIHEVRISSFLMDCYPVTNKQFAAFLNEEGNQIEKGVPWFKTDSKYALIEVENNRFVPLPSYENHPVIEVNWYGARAYATWIGGRLPTEAEWEYASRGGLEKKEYPWGDTISHDYANYWGQEGRDIWHMTSEAGYFPPNGFGLYDMAGNVWEWCNDWYDDNYYKYSPLNNPQGPDKGEFRVIRGGSWHYLPYFLRCAYRDCGKPEIYVNDLGFRCVRDI